MRGMPKGSILRVAMVLSFFLLLPSCASAPQAQVGRGLTYPQVWRSIHERHAQIEICQRAAMAKDPGFQGRFSVDFSIDKEGSVDEAKAVDSTLKNGELEKCIADVIRGTTFDRPQGGKTVPVTFPFTFKLAGIDRTEPKPKPLSPAKARGL
jgi:TonB family protein